MFYYKETEFIVVYINEDGYKKTTTIYADDLEHATEKAESLSNRYDWKKIKTIRSR